MQRIFLLSKLHQAAVTEANKDYFGSFGMDADIMKAADILENEQVQVYNISNGERFTTYAIATTAGSRTMCANGACAHLVNVGDRVIICTYGNLEKQQWQQHQPRVLFLNENNDFIVKKYSDIIACAKNEFI